MNRYVLSRDAERDLEDLWDYIAEESVEAADRLIARFSDAFEELGRFPSLGHKREDLTKFPVLFWPVGNYLIIYRAEQTPIQIVAVVHGSRDIPAFLRRRADQEGKPHSE